MTMPHGGPQPDAHSSAATSEAAFRGLQSADPAVRLAAARQLSGVHGAVPAISRCLEIERDLAVRDAMVEVLVASDSPLACERLVGYMRSEDAALRTAAAVALARMPSTEAVVLGLMVDPDPDVRILTVMTLGALELDAVPQWLLSILDHDAHPNVVGAALNVLADVGDASMVDVVHDVGARFATDPFIAFVAPKVADRLLERG